MQRLLNKLISKYKVFNENGKVADYIPELSKADPMDLGIAIIDTERNVFAQGDYEKKFTIQSISKVLALMLAITDNGEDVFKKVGMEGTDEPFNTLYKLDLPNVDKPANPMINAGAIVVTSLVKGSGEQKLNRLLDVLRKITSNNNICINTDVYLSEKHTGDKNKSIAYLLKNKGLIQGEVEEVLDAYFKQSSIELNCIDLARVGLFFARKGIAFDGKTRLIDEALATMLTAIMLTCGMYNFSGEYAVRVGIPSKSGVSGGILAVVPGRYGIGVYGPALDEFGNSLRGYKILRDLSSELNLSIFA